MKLPGNLPVKLRIPFKLWVCRRYHRFVVDAYGHSISTCLSISTRKRDASNCGSEIRGIQYRLEPYC